MRRRIVAVAERPEFWLSLLLVWVCVSGLRSWDTLWARAAGTESLRWSIGIGLSLTLGTGLRRTSRMAQVLTVCLGMLAAVIVFAGRQPNGMVTGPYGDHQLCASALLALLPFSVSLALAAPRPAWRWAGQIIALTAAVCLALTQTRAAWAGGIIGGCVFACLWMGRSEIGPHRIRRFLIPTLLGIGVALAFLFLVRGTDMGDPLAARAATLSALGQDSDWQWRLHTWAGVIRMISVHPVIGWGPGHYASGHSTFTRLTAPISPIQRPTLSDEAHSFYLQTAVDLGLIGLGLYLAALAAFARLAMRTMVRRFEGRGHGDRYAMRDALLIATLSLVAAQGIDGLASPSWQFADVSLLFWLGLGLGLAATRSDRREEDVALPGIVRRSLQYCAVGAAAVFLVSQALPAGLLPASAAPLSPQQNYAPTLTGLVVTEATGITSVSAPYPSNLPYTATATYSDNTTSDVTSLAIFCCEREFLF